MIVDRERPTSDVGMRDDRNLTRIAIGFIVSVVPLGYTKIDQKVLDLPTSPLEILGARDVFGWSFPVAAPSSVRRMKRLDV